MLSRLSISEESITVSIRSRSAGMARFEDGPAVDPVVLQCPSNLIRSNVIGLRLTAAKLIDSDSVRVLYHGSL